LCREELGKRKTVKRYLEKENDCHQTLEKALGYHGEEEKRVPVQRKLPKKHSLSWGVDVVVGDYHGSKCIKDCIF